MVFSAILTLPKSASTYFIVYADMALTRRNAPKHRSDSSELLHLRLVEAVQAWNLKVSVVTSKVREQSNSRISKMFCEPARIALKQNYQKFLVNSLSP